MALVVGLEGICRSYDFRTPVADRIVVPTADGTNAVTDCLTESRRIACIGRKIMGWPEVRHAHWFDFGEPDAAQGFMPEATARGVKVEQLLSASQASSLAFRYSLPIGGVARISTPMLHQKTESGYSIVSTGKLYPGMAVKATLDRCVASGAGSAPTAALFLRVGTDEAEAKLVYSEAVSLATGAQLEITVPDLEGFSVTSLGVEIRAEGRCEGVMSLQSIDLLETPFHYRTTVMRLRELGYTGWITDCDFTWKTFSDDKEALAYVGKNMGKGYAYTGNRFWKDQSIEARLCVHLADQAGLVARFQGLQRHLSLTRRGNRLVLAQQYYGETILAEVPCDWPLCEVHALRLECKGDAVSGYLDGVKRLEATCTLLGDGAAGFVFENGLLGFVDVDITGSAVP